VFGHGHQLRDVQLTPTVILKLLLGQMFSQVSSISRPGLRPPFLHG